MKEVDNSTVIDLTDNPKNAALYFNKVAPFNPLAYEDEHLLQIMPKLLPSNISMDENALYVDDSFRYEFRINQKDKNEELRGILFNLLTAYFYGYQILYPSNDSIFQDTSYDTISLKLANLPLIDTSKAEWDKILEMRKDKDSINKLRKLKTHFHDNYYGKEKQYIEDKLIVEIEEYNSTVKKWGFETLISSLVLLNTIPMIQTGSSLIKALTGQSIEEAAIQGVCVGLAGASLLVSKKKHNLLQLGRDHPLAYIIDAKKKLEKE